MQDYKCLQVVVMTAFGWLVATRLAQPDELKTSLGAGWAVWAQLFSLGPAIIKGPTVIITGHGGGP